MIKMSFAVLAVGIVLIGGMTPITAAAEEAGYTGQRYFSGTYVGVGVGQQLIIAGADGNGTDVLAHEGQTVAEIFGGYRWQFANGLTIGGEIGHGRFDGNLSLHIPSRAATFTYEGESQFQFGGQIGYAFGTDRDWLVFGYISETKREFDVTIELEGETFRQEDEQGILRFGLGLERQLLEHFSLRATLGTSRSNFDGLTYNEPDNEVELGLGLIYQF